VGDDITVVRRFDPSDQEHARALILEGLKEHWGQIDPSLNRDLDDIAVTYKDGLFLVACRGPDLIAMRIRMRRPQPEPDPVLPWRLSTSASCCSRFFCSAYTRHGCIRLCLH